MGQVYTRVKRVDKSLVYTGNKLKDIGPVYTVDRKGRHSFGLHQINKKWTSVRFAFESVLQFRLELKKRYISLLKSKKKTQNLCICPVQTGLRKAHISPVYTRVKKVDIGPVQTTRRLKKARICPVYTSQKARNHSGLPRFKMVWFTHM